MSKKGYQIALVTVIILFVAVTFIRTTNAQFRVITGPQGGTGFGTTTPANVGYCLQVASTTPFLTYAFQPCSSGSATTTINTLPGPAFSFTSANGIGLSSSTGNLHWYVLGPLEVPGTATSTIYGDGTESVIGGPLRVQGAFTLITNPVINFSADGSYTIDAQNFTPSIAIISPSTTSTLRLCGQGSNCGSGTDNAAVFDISQLTADRVFSFPDQTGTLLASTTGNWTGTFDGQEGTYYLARANHTGTQNANTILDFTTTTRGLFSAGTGMQYDSSTGVFTNGGVNSFLTATGTIGVSTSTDTNLGIVVSRSGQNINFLPVWIGTLDNSRIASSSAWAVKAANLSDLTSVSTARTNLGLADTATLASSTWLKVANNGSDISSTSTFRNTVLGTGTGAQMYFGDGAFKTASTTNITEGTNLYYTDTRARAVWNQDLYPTSSPTFANVNGSSVLNAAIDIINGSSSAIRFRAGPSAVGTPFFQLWGNNSTAGFAGQIYFDAGSSTIAAIFFRGGPAATTIMKLTAGGGVQIGAPTGGDKGAGSLNVAADIYKNNSAYANPDYVFEKWATGKIEKYITKDGAKDYAGLRPLNEVRNFVAENWHLPRFGQNAKLGLFSGGDALLASVEEAYLYIFQLSDQIQGLRDSALATWRYLYDHEVRIRHLEQQNAELNARLEALEKANSIR